MKEKKKSFILYCDYRESIEMLDMEERGTLFTAVMDYANGVEPQLENRTVKIIFELIRHQLDRDLEKYEMIVEKKRQASKRGGEANKKRCAQEESLKEPDGSHVEPNGYVEEPDNDNDTGNGNGTGNDTGNGNGTGNGNDTGTGSVTDSVCVNETVRVPEATERDIVDWFAAHENGTHTPKGSRPHAPFQADPPIKDSGKMGVDRFTPEDFVRRKSKNPDSFKEKRMRYGDYVTLTPAEHAQLIQEFGKEKTERMIQIVSDHKGISPKKYEADYNDFYAIRSWGAERYEKERKIKGGRKAESVKASYDRDELEDFWNKQ